MKIEELKEKILSGGSVTREEALALESADVEELSRAADEIRRRFAGDGFDACTIINAKSGCCTENCKFCAQSAAYRSGAKEYPLINAEEALREAQCSEERGIARVALVTSGRRLGAAEVDAVCEIYAALREKCGISLCASHGLLTYKDFVKLRAAGVTRIHNNLETSRRNFPNVCTTHSYDDKISAIKAAMRAGLEVCSGGIIGMGESFADRADMAFELRGLGVKSVPLNVLNPIPGTPYENLPRLAYDDVRRAAALFRFILPDAAIRMAGGRGLLADKGRAVFRSGANAAISGDMLTTAGISVEEDMRMIKELGYEVKRP